MIRSDNYILNKTIKEINSDYSIDDNEKVRRIAVVNKVISEKDIKKRYSLLYDMICDYLDNEFRCNNICGFKDDLCVRRRDMIKRGVKKDTYINGCCHGYRTGECKNLINGKCTVKNIGCKIFTCPFLRKQGIKYSINKIYFAKNFFNLKQKIYMENTFFVDKNVIMEGILKRK